MTLIDDYKYLGSDNGKVFLNMVTEAAYYAATDALLSTTPVPDDTTLAFCAACLKTTAVKWLARAMVTQGLDHESGDATLKTSIANNFTKLALLYKVAAASGV